MDEQWPYDEWNWSQLREEVTRLTQAYEQTSAAYFEMRGMYDKERVLNGRLALYVQHHGGCSWKYPDLRCTCGLSDLITTMASHQ